MSLHDLANQVQSAGRNDDKVLVHMTPGEVKGLQSIAMAHGGSLTINPQTGLPEAGFLSSILPMVAGLGLSMIPGVGPMMAAGIVGGGTAIATGDLKKGLMAGLGAYGGAGLGAGLSSMGAQGAAASSIDDIALASKNAASTSQIGNAYGNVAAAPTQVFGAPNLATTATPNITNVGANLTDDLAMSRAGINNSYSSISSVPAASPPPTFDKALLRPSAGQVNPTVVTGTSQPSVGFNQSFSGRLTSDYMPQSNFNVGKNLGATGAEGVATAVPTQTISRPFTDAMNQMGRGAKEAFSSTKGLGQLYDAMPTGSVVASGLTLAEGLKPEEKTPEKTKSLIRPYEFDYNSTNVSAEPYSGSAERTYFNPVFTAKEPYEAPGAEYAASGGLMGYAVGGPVEDMAAMNAVGANTGYPMANLQTPMYSNPAMQRPEAMNVIAPSADYGVSTYSGEPRFARGGSTAEPESSGYSYDYNPTTMQFTQTGGPGASGGIGGFGKGIITGPESFALTQKQYQAALADKNARQAATPNGTVSGGMVQPMMQPAAPAQPFVPDINIPAYQTPEQQLGLGGFYDMMNRQLAGYGGYAAGGGVRGESHLGDYSDGGRLLKGPGDGVSDSIPAVIGKRQPARLADGEFVVPARIVSELGNGSTQAGARKLYAMMDRVQNARKKSVGKKKVAVNSRADKYLPA
jgi:hypothetical protein